MISRLFDPESRILFVDYSGETTEDQLITHIRGIEADESLPRVLRILERHFEVEKHYDVTAEVRRRVKEEAERTLLRFTRIGLAAVHDQPRLMAYTLRYSHAIESQRLAIEVFSTEAAARDWLDTFVPVRR